MYRKVLDSATYLLTTFCASQISMSKYHSFVNLSIYLLLEQRALSYRQQNTDTLYIFITTECR